MISITSKTGSSEGVIFKPLPDSDLRNMAPRVTKTKTLDGGTVVDHRGMVTGDREFRIKARLTQQQFEALQNIVENETFVNIASSEGFFEGVIQYLSIVSDITEILFWVYVPPEDTTSNTRRMLVSENLIVTESITVSVS